MKDLVKKVAVGIATGSLLVQTMVLPSFAEIRVVVSGNGSDSENEVELDLENETLVQQSNVANIQNNIKAEANSGENEAEDNTGGNINIDTGNAKAMVDVHNAVNSNEARVACGGCPTDLSVEISGNGSDSENEVEVELDNKTWVDQSNRANLTNKIEVEANSGENEANDNTGGEVDIDTGNADASAVVRNRANANLALVGSDGQGSLDLLIIGNGSESENEIELDLDNEVGILQNNWANIENDVEVEANSGENEAEDNTGGAISINTGNADAGVLVDTMANFNAAAVLDCCEFEGLVKVAGNGADSENEVELELESGLFADQSNRYTCGGEEERGWDWEWPWHKDKCDVEAEANTGENDAEDNTGAPDSDPSIDTGDATTEVEVSHEANSNVFTTGDAELPDFDEFDLGEEGLNFLVWVMALLG